MISNLSRSTEKPFILYLYLSFSELRISFMAIVIFLLFRGGTRMPLNLFFITSLEPMISVEITGHPESRDSKWALGNPSHKDEDINKSAIDKTSSILGYDSMIE